MSDTAEYVWDVEAALTHVQVFLGILILAFPFVYHSLSRHSRRWLAAVNYLLYRRLGRIKINLIQEGVRIGYYTILTIYGKSLKSRAFVSLIVSGLSIYACFYAVSVTGYAALIKEQKLAFEISLSPRLHDLRKHIPRATETRSLPGSPVGTRNVYIPVHTDDRSKNIRELIKKAESEYFEELRGHPNQFQIAMLGLMEPPYWQAGATRSNPAWLMLISFLCDFLSVIASLTILRWTLDKIGIIAALTGFSLEIVFSAAVFVFAMWSTGQFLSGFVFSTDLPELYVVPYLIFFF